MCVQETVLAQEVNREQPTWWFGVAGAANMNFYGGTTQTLNSALMTPSPFHKGYGTGLYLAPLVEYRPDSVWGGILQVAYDDRRGSFNDAIRPCGQVTSLSATISYLSIEPSLRFAPFSDGFYIFAGPRIGFNWAFNFQKSSTSDEKAFVYTQGAKSPVKGEFSAMRGTVFSGQIGVGHDFALASPNNENQVNVSPFISFQPYFGQDPRSVDSWAVSTLRVGAAIKFGSGAVIPQVEPAGVAAVVEGEVQFTVRSPKAVPIKRRVRETFPLRNYVFFDENSNEIPNRYVMLTKDQAASFTEEQLQEVQPKSMAGRPLRQMNVYYNILNIYGDRMKRSPGTTISLTGSSPEQGPEFGKARAETIKLYLVDVFGIDGSRITTEGRDKPRIPSEMPGATIDLDLLKAGDRRVDIESTSPELMIQVGGAAHYMPKPVQLIAEVEDPLDGHVLFNVAGAREVFASWSLEITDDQGKVQRFGPSTRDQENVSGNTLLGDRPQGDYKIVMLGETKGGKFVRKDTSIHLVRRDEPKNDVVRFRILFDFDKSKTIESYDKFLTEIVVPLIPDNGLVIIHGYTDIIGEEEYNENLSRERAQDVRKIIERAIANSEKHGITFETFGFGENLQYASFDNHFPEERFYNRSVIIDIVPD
jgi:outer membrane protein OmpA-like peptidoglycan-associated protein